MKSLLWISFLLPVCSMGQNNPGTGFSLKGSVKGLPENSTVYMISSAEKPDTVARTHVKDGQFTLTGRTKEPMLYELNFGVPDKKIGIFMGNDAVTAEGSADDLQGIVIKGAPSNEQFRQFQQSFNPYFLRLNSIVQTANLSQDNAKRDSLYQVYKAVVDTVQQQLDKYVQNNRSSYVTPFVMVVLAQLTEDVSVTEKRLNALSPEVQKSYYASMLRKQIDESKIGAVGTNAIDFVQNDTAGRAVSLSSYKGKYVLVDFWASWCGPCRQENPNVVSTYNKFKNKNFTVLGVSLDKAKEPWLKAIKDDGLTWTQVSDLKFWNNDVAVKYHVQAIPQNILIDPNGKIIGKNLRGADLQAKLCEILGCN